MAEETLFETTTTNLAAYLVYCEHTVVEFKFREGRCTFVFRRNKALDEDVVRFTGGNALVEPREFSKVYGTVRSEMFAERDRLARG